MDPPISAYMKDYKDSYWQINYKLKFTLSEKYLHVFSQENLAVMLNISHVSLRPLQHMSSANHQYSHMFLLGKVAHHISKLEKIKALNSGV